MGKFQQKIEPNIRGKRRKQNKKPPSTSKSMKYNVVYILIYEALRAWYIRIYSYLANNGFNRSNSMSTL